MVMLSLHGNLFIKFLFNETVKIYTPVGNTYCPDKTEIADYKGLQMLEAGELQIDPET